MFLISTTCPRILDEVLLGERYLSYLLPTSSAIPFCRSLLPFYKDLFTPSKIPSYSYYNFFLPKAYPCAGMEAAKECEQGLKVATLMLPIYAYEASSWPVRLNL